MTATADRRRATRFHPTPEAVCRCADGDGVVWNLSATGARLLLDRPLKVGEAVEVVLANSRLALPVWATVVHVLKVSPTDVFVGAQFVRPLEDQELGPFIGGALEG